MRKLPCSIWPAEASAAIAGTGRASAKQANAAQTAGRVHVRIPKGFRPKAQGCEERATLGAQWGRRFNPERVAASPACAASVPAQRHNPFRVDPIFTTITQGSSFLAAL